MGDDLTTRRERQGTRRLFFFPPLLPNAIGRRRCLSVIGLEAGGQGKGKKGRVGEKAVSVIGLDKIWAGRGVKKPTLTSGPACGPF